MSKTKNKDNFDHCTLPYDPEKFIFLPIGGCNEIGMNLNLFIHQNQILIVDLGISFHDKVGIDVLTPDPTFLINYKHLIKGIVFTHAHEDHVGALPYLWSYLECPLYATPFTAQIIRNKIYDKMWKKRVEIHELDLNAKFKIGVFDLEFITLTHSIPEPNAIKIQTPKGIVLHSGDWKLDPHPQIGKETNIKRLQELGKEGVLALICDSTNIFTEGTSGSEKDVYDSLKDVMSRYTNERLIISCFASNVARVQSIIKIAHDLGRKTCLVGRSMHKMVSAARETGYLTDLPELISEEEIKRYKSHELCILTTGSQGEHKAGLARIVSKIHPQVRLDENDVVIFSSRMIPGNEKAISSVQNQIIHQGAQIVTSMEEDIHTSGHPAREELRQMYDWVKPSFLIPVHGDARHLDAHGKFAYECGVDNVFIPENGSVVSLSHDEFDEIEVIPTAKWAFDGNRLIPLNSETVKERYKLSDEGACFVTIVVNDRNLLSFSPVVKFFGIVATPEEEKNLTQEIEFTISRILETVSVTHKNVTSQIEIAIRKMIFGELNKKSIVCVHLLEE